MQISSIVSKGPVLMGHHIRVSQGQRASQNKKYIIFFLIFGAIEGLTFIFNIGPLTMPDPGMHLPATYATATGQQFNFAQQTGSEGEKGASILSITGDSIYLTPTTANNVTIENILTSPQQMTKYQKDQQKEFSSHVYTRITSTDNRANQYSFLPYIPQAIGMRLGLSTDSNAWRTLQLSRLSNLVFYLAVICMAICVAPRGKPLIVLISLFPVSMFCASSIMADGMVICTCALFVCSCFALLHRATPLNIYSLLGLGILGFLVGSVKVSYFPLILLILLASPHAIRPKPRNITTIITLLCSLVASLLWTRFLAKTPGTYMQVDKYEAIHNPIKFLTILASNTVIDPVRLIAGFPLLLVWCIAALTVIAYLIRIGPTDVKTTPLMITITRRVQISVPQLVLLVLMLCLAATFAPIMMTTSDLTEMTYFTLISGFQTRYLSPLAPLLLGFLYLRRQTPHPIQTLEKASASSSVYPSPKNHHTDVHQ